MKPCKDGVRIALELSKVNLQNFTCDKQCYKCIYWNDYCMASVVRAIIVKSNNYLNNHKE